jgi:pimeloyl-ACP methyl ester carboxylesterase
VTYAGLYPEDVRALVLLDSGHLDYADLAESRPDATYEERLAEVRGRPDPRNAESRALAMVGLTDRISNAWETIARHRIPTLLLLATEPPHGDTNRLHVGRFAATLPQAEVRWIDGAGHGIVDTTGPGLGDDLAEWLARHAA